MPPSPAAAMARNPQSKRILSLDGGGIRGVITLEVLLEIERQLRAAHGRPDLVLADYFDLVAGTSSGAIIATLVSMGWPVARIREFYQQQGKAMFDHAAWWERLSHLYRGEHLRELLQRELGDATLGSDRLRTLLMLVMRNVTTDREWIVTNNPDCRFNRPDQPGCQLNLPLWQLVRASTAAPGFFPPETIQVGEHEFVFVDGSISSFTNPAFYAFLRAVAKPYDIRWPAGEDRVLLVSVGTGIARHQRRDMKAEDYGLFQAATTVPTSLILSTVLEQDTLCRIFGKCLNGHQLDRDLGDLVGMETPGGQHMFTYVRYNEEITREGLSRLGLGDLRADALQAIDSTDALADLTRVGERIALQVRPEHLPTIPL